MGHGLALLPEPDDGDVFLDFEGHPFFTPKPSLLRGGAPPQLLEGQHLT